MVIKFVFGEIRIVLEDPAPVLAEVKALRGEIKALREQSMTKLTDIQSKVTALNEQTTKLGDAQGEQAVALANVAGDIERIKAQIVGGLTADEADGVVASLDGVLATVTSAADGARTQADALKALAADNPEPAEQPTE